MLREPAGLSLPQLGLFLPAGSAVGSCYRWRWHPETRATCPLLGSPEASPPLYPVLIWKQMEGGATNPPRPRPRLWQGPSFLEPLFCLH